MKKLLFIAALFAATTTQAQNIDTVKSSIQVVPTVYNSMQKDTLYQLTVNVFDLKLGDSTQGCNSYVSFYDRKAKNIGSMNVPIPSSVVNIWSTDDKVVENFILNFLGLKRK